MSMRVCCTTETSRHEQTSGRKPSMQSNWNGTIRVAGRDNAVGGQITVEAYLRPFPYNLAEIQRVCPQGKLSPKVVRCVVEGDTVTFSNAEECVAASCSPYQRDLGSITLTRLQIIDFLPDFIPEWSLEGLKRPKSIVF